MALALKAENISKQYRLGLVGSGTFANDLGRWWAKLQGKPDPLLKVGEMNNRATKGKSDYVWALKGIDFEVEQGDVLGIIGKNGAGKSTLLKILSKITAPTEGQVKIKGRIASLLEVGTGFHPELTGRENIFLNGAILGMTRNEVKRKFDEIVDFAGVERYIDTPVKRYSSGMYVRLAFAVAAHLENEILIVDEVLAVGDSEFQKKCLGKMGEVSRGQGRTVLFVSHNMGAIKQLCNKAVLLSESTIQSFGDVSQVTAMYFSHNQEKIKSIPIAERTDRTGNQSVKIVGLKLNSRDAHEGLVFDSFEGLEIEIDIFNVDRDFSGVVMYGIYDKDGNRVMYLDSNVFGGSLKTNAERILLKTRFPTQISLWSGPYSLNVAVRNHGELADYIQRATTFELRNINFFRTGREQSVEAVLLTRNTWELSQGA